MVEGLDRLRDLGIPIVAVDRRLPRLELDTVTVESERAVAKAMGHLIGLGHRRIGLMAGPEGAEHVGRPAARV